MPDYPAHRSIWLFVWRLPKPSIAARSSSEAGLTIMECLVAILLILTTIAMIAPPLVLATATRVQNRRADQALQVAQGEIDRLRTMVAMGAHTPARLPAVAASATLASVTAPTAVDTRLRSLNLNGTGCPTARFDPNSTPPPATLPVSTLLPVDVDGDCTADYLVQMFRTAGQTSTVERATGRLNRPSEFDVGIRVYPIQAGDNLGSLTTAPAPLQLTSGSQTRRPLAVLYSKFVWTEEETSLCSYFSQAARQQIASCSGVFPNSSP